MRGPTRARSGATSLQTVLRSRGSPAGKLSKACREDGMRRRNSSRCRHNRALIQPHAARPPQALPVSGGQLDHGATVGESRASRRRAVSARRLHRDESPALELPRRAALQQARAAEPWIKEGKQAAHWTRLSCHRFRVNAVRLQLSVLAYNLGNGWAAGEARALHTGSCWPRATWAVPVTGTALDGYRDVGCSVGKTPGGDARLPSSSHTCPRAPARYAAHSSIRRRRRSKRSLRA